LPEPSSTCCPSGPSARIIERACRHPDSQRHAHLEPPHVSSAKRPGVGCLPQERCCLLSHPFPPKPSQTSGHSRLRWTRGRRLRTADGAELRVPSCHVRGALCSAVQQASRPARMIQSVQLSRCTGELETRSLPCVEGWKALRPWKFDLPRPCTVVREASSLKPQGQKAWAVRRSCREQCTEMKLW
jgi:hypothetical protein